jgi:hypothetical protein
MSILSVHDRRFAGVTPEAAAHLIDGLSSADDRLWPHRTWPPMRFDRALGEGAAGGHGFVRYHVSEYRPGSLVRFHFSAPRGLRGEHRFMLVEHGDGCRIDHVIEGSTAWWFKPAWYLLVRPLHDALLEDALDRAELDLTDSVAEPARWSWWVRLLRKTFGG